MLPEIQHAVEVAEQRADENDALKRCCESAEQDIILAIWNDLKDPQLKPNRHSIAAIIYKHMRNGREL